MVVGGNRAAGGDSRRRTMEVDKLYAWMGGMGTAAAGTAAGRWITAGFSVQTPVCDFNTVVDPSTSIFDKQASYIDRLLFLSGL